MKLLTIFLILLSSEIGGASIYTWVALIVLPTISSIISWFVGKRQRNNDAIENLQKTVNSLVAKNSELYGKIVDQNKIICDLNDKNNDLGLQLKEVRKENAELKVGQERMSAQLTKVQKENAGLKRQLAIFISRKEKEVEQIIA